MRRLLLLRHSESERSGPGASDRDRVLTERGRMDARSMGIHMARHAIAPDLVLMSPALRAEETWRQAAAAFRPAPRAQSVGRLYDATAHAIFNVVAEAPAYAHNLLVIGHNPALHELAILLIASGDIEAREFLREKLPTSGLVVIEFAFDDWTQLHPHAGRLERFISPKSIAPATN